MDYEAVNTTVSFPQDSVNGTEICIEIPIIDDDCFEKYEIFWFHIYATEPNLHIYNHEYVPVHIYDDEGEKFKKLESLRYSLLVTCADVYVSFTEYEYFVHESEGEVRVYLELFGVWKPIQTGIWIHVFTTDNTAIGKGGREGMDARK